MYYLKTSLQYGLTLLAAMLVNFLLPRLAPGSPINSILSNDAIQAMSEAEIQEVLAEFGLDRPLPEQFWTYATGIFTGHFGDSVALGMPAFDALMQRLPWTLLLMGGALVFSTLLGTVLGIVSAWRRGEISDAATVSGVLFVGSLPPFWLAMMLIILFSTHLGWLPSFGAYEVGVPAGTLDWYLGIGKRLILPVLSLGLVQSAAVLLISRSSMMIALEQDYIVFARAKGLAEKAIFFRHAFRNALLPLYTNVMMGLGSLVGGALVVETVFAYPGLGSLVVLGVNARDYNLIQGIFILVSVSVILTNFLSDMFYPLIDPRTRRAGVSR